MTSKNSTPIHHILNGERALQNERRISPRISETLPVKLKGKSLEAQLFTLDVGLGGIRIFWNLPLIVGHEYDLSIALTPIKSWIRVRAQVLWQVRANRQLEIALKFTEVSRVDRRKLEEYVQHHSQKHPLSAIPAVSNTIAEKRKHQRVSGRLPVALWPANRNSAKVASGMIVDLSLGGAGCIANYLFQRGEEVTLQIQLASKQAALLQLSGTIVRSQQLEAIQQLNPELVFLHAIKFNPYSAEIKRILESHLEYRNSTKELNLAQNLLDTVKN